MTNDIHEESLPTIENTPELVAEPAAETAPAAIAAAEPIAAPSGVEPVASPAPKPAATAKPTPAPVPEPVPEEPEEDFGALLSQFEKSHSHKAAPGQKQLQGTVISLSADQVFLDIGYKTEGVLPRSAFNNNAEGVKVGDSFPVSVTGRDRKSVV